MIEFIKYLFEQFQHYILPFTIVRVYEAGVRLRFGKNPTIIKNGVKFKWPFIDEIITCIMTVDTMTTHAVHVTTTDEKTITVTPVIEYQVEEPIKWLMETNDAETNLHDLTRGFVADYLTDITWEETKKKSTATEIKNKLNKKISDMGAKIHRLILADVCINRVIITQI